MEKSDTLPRGMGRQSRCSGKIEVRGHKNAFPDSTNTGLSNLLSENHIDANESENLRGVMGAVQDYNQIKYNQDSKDEEVKFKELVNGLCDVLRKIS